MALFNNKNVLEAGVDEVARGCLAGPVYAAAVIWPNDEEMLDPNIKLKDSKKLSRKKRDELRDYIEEYAIDFNVAFCDNYEIDKLALLDMFPQTSHFESMVLLKKVEK